MKDIKKPRSNPVIEYFCLGSSDQLVRWQHDNPGYVIFSTTILEEPRGCIYITCGDVESHEAEVSAYNLAMQAYEAAQDADPDVITEPPLSLVPSQKSPRGRPKKGDNGDKKQ